MLYIKSPKLDSSYKWKFELFDQHLPIYLTSQSLALYTLFIFLRNFHIVFDHDCTNLHSYQQYMKVPFSAAAAAAKSLQCPTLCDPIDSSLPGSTVPGILQAGTLEWVTIAFSIAWKWKVKSLNRVWLFATPFLHPHKHLLFVFWWKSFWQVWGDILLWF